MPDPVKVRAHIARLMAANAAHGGTCCGQVCAAFAQAYAERNTPGASGTDPDLAVAEHYLMARCRVCNGAISRAQMRAMVLAYNTAKRVARWLGVEERLRHNPGNPTTPPSDEAVTFGLRGADDGDRDRLRCNPGADPPVLNTDEVYGYNRRTRGY